MAVLLLSLPGCVRRMIDDPVFITGGTDGRAQLTCTREFEAVPSSVAPPAGGVGWFASFDTNRMSYAQGSWSSWAPGPPNTTVQGFTVPVKLADPFLLERLDGDSWTTYSAAKNLAFFYFIGRPWDPTRSSCVAVAATAPEKLASGEWDYPATCVSSSRGDQCAILHVDATNTFYTACLFATDRSNIRLQAFHDCPGAPGPAYGCPRTALLDLPFAEVFSLAENPCTGHLAVVFRRWGQVRLRFYDAHLNEVGDTLVGNQSFEVGQANPGCTTGSIRRCGQGTPDCTVTGSAGQCLRDGARPSIDTYTDMRGGVRSCGAVIAYDSLAVADDGNLWSKSRLDVLDITDEKTPSVKAQWVSADGRFAWNHYLSYATVTDPPPHTQQPRIAWFWLTDVRGPCDVVAEGATSVDLGRSLQDTGIISGPFPAVEMGGFGMGDYIRGIKGGDFQGSLLVSWGEPVRTAARCVPCLGDTWNLATKIARIHWDRSPSPLSRATLGRESRPVRIR